jgi:maleate isomerase
MRERVLLGMVTPSSNTVLEPVTSAMIAGMPEVSAHFSRFKVTEISLSDRALQQFDPAAILDAARLLADARVQVIAWNGTSAAWLGFESDERLCRSITEATGIPATTSILVLNEILARHGVERFGLVTPYIDQIQGKILENYAGLGLRCVAERHLNDPGNFSFSEIGSEAIAEMVRDVAKAKPQVIATVCTNLRAAPLVEALERETGILILDSISVVVWKSLHLAGAESRRVQGWGRLFQTPH